MYAAAYDQGTLLCMLCPMIMSAAFWGFVWDEPAVLYAGPNREYDAQHSCLGHKTSTSLQARSTPGAGQRGGGLGRGFQQPSSAAQHAGAGNWPNTDSAPRPRVQVIPATCALAAAVGVLLLLDNSLTVAAVLYQAADNPCGCSYHKQSNVNLLVAIGYTATLTDTCCQVGGLQHFALFASPIVTAMQHTSHLV